MSGREALIAEARAAETDDPERALALWATAADIGATVDPDETGWEQRPAVLAPLRRQGPLPEDFEAWVRGADACALVGLINEISRLTDFRVGFRLKRALADCGRSDAVTAFVQAYLDMALSWRAQAYRAALEAARRALDLATSCPGLDDCPGPGPVFEVQSIRMRAALVLGEPAEDVSPDIEERRPLAVARASLIGRWKRSPEEGRGLAARLAMTDDPPPASEVLAVWLTAIGGDAHAGMAVARGLLLRRRERGDSAPPELCLAGAALAHRLGAAQTRGAWIAAYFDHSRLDTPTWPSGDVRFDAIKTSPADAREDGPKVSVAMSTFNAAATVEQAIRSLLTQSHRNLEILAVDDASSDSTVAVLHRLAAEDARIRVFETRVNAGTYVARNRALEAATGDYFTCLDADDWAHPRRLQRHVGVMERDDRLVATRSNWFRMAEDGEPALRRSLGVFTHANPASPFYRTHVVRETIGYYDRVRIDGDLEHWLRLTTRFGLRQTARLRLPLTIGRLHAGSLTQSGAGAQDEEAYSPIRSEYRAAALAWRERALADKTLALDIETADRPFPAPEAMLP
ncbi:glycosyltransferase family 2 protein [Brevundimonas sp.]|uniref:glycosyltransferase family 2 protein n=1 Tax=Brevundimonas sp. TaxID=1871086 RepID=UPI0035AE8BF8